MAEEKIYTVPLGKAYNYIRTKRTRRAVSLVKQFVSRHGKVAAADVRLSNALNSALWVRGVQKPPRKVKIKVTKEKGIAKAYLVEEEIKKPEPKKEAAAEGKKEREAEAGVAKTEAKKEGMEAGAKPTTKAGTNGGDNKETKPETVNLVGGKTEAKDAEKEKEGSAGTKSEAKK